MHVLVAGLWPVSQVLAALHVREFGIVGVMATNLWKATVVLSSDHAGINRELGLLESELLHVLGRIEDPRKVRDFVDAVRTKAHVWAYENNVDMRGWLERTRKRTE